MKIATLADATVAGYAAQRMALESGGGRIAARELAIIVVELATNQVRHAGGGVIELETAGSEIVVCATDEGPGIADLDRSRLDHVSASPASLGCGLGAIYRLSDSVHISNRLGGGLMVRCTKRARAA